MIPPRLALIHATRLAMPPVEEAASALWPEAEVISLLDESLEIDRERQGHLTDAMSARIVQLAEHAAGFGADGVLFTCSAFGAAVEAADQRLPVPVMKPNEAMFLAALAHGPKLAMVYTFPPAAAGMSAEFKQLAAACGCAATLDTIHCSGALNAKRSGDSETHDRLIAECVASLTGYDAILLAQFSMASAASRLRSQTDTPVETSPESAVKEMRRRVEAATDHIKTRTAQTGSS